MIKNTFGYMELRYWVEIEIWGPLGLELVEKRDLVLRLEVSQAIKGSVEKH